MTVQSWPPSLRIEKPGVRRAELSVLRRDRVTSGPERPRCCDPDFAPFPWSENPRYGSATLLPSIVPVNREIPYVVLPAMTGLMPGTRSFFPQTTRKDGVKPGCFAQAVLSLLAAYLSGQKPRPESGLLIAALKRSTPESQNRASWGPRRCAAQKPVIQPYCATQNPRITRPYGTRFFLNADIPRPEMAGYFLASLRDGSLTPRATLAQGRPRRRVTSCPCEGWLAGMVAGACGGRQRSGQN